MLDFFKDSDNKLSMGRLLSFMVIFILCFEAIYSIIFLKKWELDFNRVILFLTSITGKVSSLFFEKRKASK
ncbi:MAG: hypothetical protein N2485_08320 [bacterium]|nr:hypothetical protein [bacterium]